MELVSSSAPKMHIESIISKVVWALMSFVIALLVIVILIAMLVQKDSFWDILPIILVLLVVNIKKTNINKQTNKQNTNINI